MQGKLPTTDAAHVTNEKGKGKRRKKMDNNNYNNGDYTAPESGNNSGDGSNNSQYNTSGEYTSVQYNSNDQYSTSGQYNANDQYNNGQYNANDQYSNNGQYNANGQYDANNQYNTSGQYYANGQYNNNGQYNANGQYNQNGQYNMNGQQYQYNNNGYGQGPVDNNGKPIPNNFGLKLTFSILITIFLSKIFGILSIIFTCLQNKAYKEGRWDDFKNKRKLSNVFLWIGLILGVIILVIWLVFVGAVVKESLNAASDYDYSYSYEYDDDDDDYTYDDDTDNSDDDFDYDDSSDSDTDSDYIYGDSTFDFDSVEQMTINGAAVSVPMSVTDFIAATGIDTYRDVDALDAYDLSGHNGGEMTYIDDENGRSLIDIYNGTDDDIKAIDGTIGGIKLDFEDISSPIQFEYRGITNASSLDDVLDILGEADTQYNGSYGTELTYYTTNGWLEFDWDTDGAMTSIWIENYGEID